MNSQEQIERIKLKLITAKKVDKDLKVFRSSEHKYILHPTIDEEIVLNFEKKHNVSFPECYRTFVTKIGNGGVSFADSAAGPYYGIYPFGKNLDDMEEDQEKLLNLPAVVFPGMAHDYKIQGRSIYDGLLPIGTQGCTLLHALVMNGEYEGRIVYAEMQKQTFQFAEDKNFLDWYERWLDEIISGRLLVSAFK